MPYTRVAPLESLSARSRPSARQFSSDDTTSSRPPLRRRIAVAPNRRQKKEKGCCKKLLAKIWTLVFLLSAAAAAYFWYDNKVKYNDSKSKFGYERPATENSFEAATNFQYSCYLIFAISLVGFAIIHIKIIEIYVGIIYMFGLTLCLYFASSSLSHAIYSIHNDGFIDVFKFIRQEYNATRNIPVFIKKYQQKHKCCGWSDRFPRVWSEKYLEQDFYPEFVVPDSCCVHSSRGCGRPIIISEKPSGYITPLLTTPPGSNLELCDDQLRNRGVNIEERNPNFISTVPDEYLRLIDLLYYLDSSFEAPKICIIANDGPFGRLAYFSYGPGELRSLTGVIFTHPCDYDGTTNKSLGGNWTTDFDRYPHYKNYENVIHGMVWLLILPTAVLSSLCLVMSFIFMYYFSKLNREKIKKLAQPREFTDYDIEALIDKRRAQEDSDEEDATETAYNALSLELQRLDMERRKAVLIERQQKDKYDRMRAKSLQQRREEKDKKVKFGESKKSEHKDRRKKK